MTPCECGLAYVTTNPSDRRLHRKIHDEYLNGIPIRPSHDDQVLSDAADLRITLVRPSASWNQRQRTKRISRRCNREMHYDFGGVYHAMSVWEFESHAFICAREERAIGFLLLEKHDHVWRAAWKDWKDGYSPPLISKGIPRWTLVFAWVLPPFRRQGIGRRLVDAAVAFAGIPLAEMGFYTPFSEAGEKLVRSLCPEELLIVR